MSLLIVTVYMLAFLIMREAAGFSIIDILMSTVQVINLVFLLQLIIGPDKVLLSGMGNHFPVMIIESVFFCLILLRFLLLFRIVIKRRQKPLIPQSIRETINHLPGGICFATLSGKPILTNFKMNELFGMLTGHTIMNALVSWEELRTLEPTNGCAKLDNEWIDQDRKNEAHDETLFFSFPDSSIWRFQKEALMDREPHYIQLEATEASDLYRYSKELFDNNQRLEQQYQRQQNLLTNIVEINHEKEILQAKMRIHDDLGKSILTTKQHLFSQTLSENAALLTEVWMNTILGLEGFGYASADTETSPEIELQRSAEMIGCRINFNGARPVERKTALLFYAIVREALTNAVLHANANELKVDIHTTERGYHVETSDNGSTLVSTITEGSGLSNLRKRLEQEGATLEVKYEDGVVLVVELPVYE